LKTEFCTEAGTVKYRQITAEETAWTCKIITAVTAGTRRAAREVIRQERDAVIEQELRAIDVYITWAFWTFSVPVTLTLARWPSYTNLTRIAQRYTGFANMNCVCQSFRKLSSDRQTNRQTDRQNRPKL